MMSPHRRAHRWIWMVLAVTLPALVVFALAMRPDFRGMTGTAVEIEPGKGRIR